jgi:hypothetical protein
MAWATSSAGTKVLHGQETARAPILTHGGAQRDFGVCGWVLSTEMSTRIYARASGTKVNCPPVFYQCFAQVSTLGSTSVVVQ